jgi:hypothetical protein
MGYRVWVLFVVVAGNGCRPLPVIGDMAAGRDAATGGSTEVPDAGGGGDLGGGGPGPHVFVENVASPWAIAVNARVVYWATCAVPYSDVIMQPEDQHIAAKAIAQNQSCPQQLIATSQRVFWADGNDEVHTIALDGSGSVTTNVVSSESIMRFAVDISYVYWIRYDNNIYRNAIGSVGADLFADGIRFTPAGLVTDGHAVYWTNIASGTVVGVTAAEGTVTTLASGQTSPSTMCGDATYVYWANTNSIMKAPKDASSSASPVVRGLPRAPTTIAVDANYVYFIDPIVSTVSKASLANGAVTVLATDQKTPRDLAVSDDFVYWTSYAGNRIMRVAK